MLRSTLLALLLVGIGLAPAGAFAASDEALGGCTVSLEAPVCVFVCAPFTYVQVVGIGGDGTVSGSCAGASASCAPNYALCLDTSSNPAVGVSVGSCRYTGGFDVGFGFCTASAGSG